MTSHTGEDSSLRRVIGRLGFGAKNINGVIRAGTFGLPAIPIVAIGLCCWLISYVSLAAWLTAIGFMVFRALLYFWCKYTNKPIAK